MWNPSILIVTTIALNVAPLCAQTSIVNIQASRSRPLQAALDQLEKQLGVPINYEDPRYACPEELQDVTAQEQSPAQKAANPTARIIVPKGGTLKLAATVPASVPKTADVLPLITQLRVQHEANAYAGRFSVTLIGGAYTVQPVSARNAACIWAPVVPALETRVSFPTQRRDATETVNLVLSAVSKQVNAKIGLGTIPIHSFINRAVMVGSADQPANVALMQVLQEISAQESAIPSSQPLYSYHLLYDPGVKYYMLHIAAVAPRQSQQNAPGNGAPVPPLQGVPGGKKVQ